MNIPYFGYEDCSPDKEPIKIIPSFHFFHFIKSGYGYFNGRRLSAGQGFICEKNIYCHYYPDKSEPWSYYYIDAAGEDADIIAREMIKEFGGRVFDWNVEAEKSILDEICLLPEASEDFKHELIKCEIFYRIISRRFSSASPALSQTQQHIKEAKRIFEKSIAKQLNIDAVARQLNLSRAYLRNIFFEQTGVSPKKYFTDLKLARAKELLGLELTVSEVALAVGYTDLLQFSRMFKKHCGLSPTEFRNKAYKNASSH